MVALSYALPDFGTALSTFFFTQHPCETHTEMDYNYTYARHINRILKNTVLASLRGVL